MIVHRSTPCLICHSNSARGGVSTNQRADSYFATMCFSAFGGGTANKPSFTEAGSEKALLFSRQVWLIYQLLEMPVMGNASRIPDTPINIQMWCVFSVCNVFRIEKCCRSQEQLNPDRITRHTVLEGNATLYFLAY